MRYINVTLPSETRRLNVDTGHITRLYNNGEVCHGSDQWLFTGAVIVNRNGTLGEHLAPGILFDMLQNDRSKLFYKNGKPKFRITDFDHGTQRVQMCPKPIRFHAFTDADK